MRPSLFWKIFGSSLALIVLTALVAFLIATNRIQTAAEQETESMLRTQVTLLEELYADVLRGDVPPDLQEKVRALGKQADMRITIIRADGVVLADASKDPTVMDDHSKRPEVVASLDAEFGSSARHSDTLNIRMMYVARTVRRGEEVVGWIRGALPLVRLEERWSTLTRTLFGSMAFAVLIGLLAAFYMARRLSRPLRGMRDAAQAIAGGDFSLRVPVPSGDEVGELASSFNEMARRLEVDVQTIRRDQRELRAILGSMVEGVVAVDADERVVLINEAACEILDLASADVVGHPMWETVRLPPVVEAHDRAVKTGLVQTQELRLPANGEERIIALNASPLLGEGGAKRGAVLVLDDVTERRRLEKMRADFIANVSHELKTPIASIQGLVETILEDDEMESGQRAQFLQRVLRQMRRLGDMVGEMLALSRLDSREMPVATRALDLGACLREVVGDAQPRAGERDIRIELDTGEADLAIDGEPEAVRRIAANLLDNAINFSDRGGRVLVRAHVEKQEVVLEIHDDGPGIPRDKQQRIFERFYRVEEGRDRGRGGTGLGLAIVKHLVQALGGRIDLDSDEGRGSVFRVTFRAR